MSRKTGGTHHRLQYCPRPCSNHQLAEPPCREQHLHLCSQPSWSGSLWLRSTARTNHLQRHRSLKT
jgi:hypothetical protein